MLLGQFLRRHLRVGGGGQVDDQALDVGNVGQEREDLQAVDEAPSGLLSALYLEGEDAAAVVGEVLLIQRVRGMRGQRGVVDALYLSTWRSTRSDSVSSPCSRMKALKGESVAPVSRSRTARMRVTKAAAPATSAKTAPW